MLSQKLIAAFFAALTALSEQTMASPKRLCKAHHRHTAHFDKENYTINGPLSQLDPVGKHGSLYYNGFAGLRDSSQTGVLPHSAPNEIVTGNPQSLHDGSAYITTAGQTTYFDFKGFYFGCASETASGAVGRPVACTITATGYYQGKEQISQTFVYSPKLETVSSTSSSSHTSPSSTPSSTGTSSSSSHTSSTVTTSSTGDTSSSNSNPSSTATTSSGVSTTTGTSTSQSSSISSSQTSGGLPSISLPSLPVTLPSLPVTLPSLPVTLPSLPVTLSSLPVTLPSLPATLPSLPVSLPSLPVTLPSLPSLPVTLPSLPVTLPSLPITLPSLPVTLPSLPVTLPSLPVTLPTSLPTGLPIRRSTPKSAPQKKAKIAKAACHTKFMGVDKVVFSTNAIDVVLLLDDISYVPHHCN